MRKFLIPPALVVAALAAWAVVSIPGGVDPAGFLGLADRYDVRIIRDDFGVPHIYGKSDADTAFGLAYAHAEDDFATIQDVVLATRGRLAAVRGPGAARTDYLIQLMRVWDAVDAGYSSELSDNARAVAEAYADGLNLYAARHPASVSPYLLPVRGEDLVAGFTFKLPLFYGFDRVLAQLTDGRARELARRPERALEYTSKAQAAPGSQGVAIAPGKSIDGGTRLLINSHQPLTGPVSWYEARLHSQEGWDVAGATFPGAPVILHGHNRRLGWASTVNRPDLVDVYRLTLNPDNDNEYLLDGAWVPLEVRSAAIEVRVLGPWRWTFHEPLYFSRHGPVLKLDHGSYALRWAGMGEVASLDQYLAMNKASSMDEFEAALAMGHLPSINQVYADHEGNIAHYYNAMFPDRRSGWDWSKDLPGDRSELIWNRYLPFSRIPATRNPPSGFVFNANNAPFLSTVGAGQPRPGDYPPSMGIETRATNRALRLRRLLAAAGPLRDEDFRRIKYDLFYDEALDAIVRLRAFLAKGDRNLPAALRDAFALLASWDLGTQMDNRAAALATLTLEPLIDHRRRRSPVDLAQELARAQNHLETHFGRIDPAYGDVVRHARGDTSWPIDGGPDILRAVYTETDTKSGRLHNVAGDSFIMFVTWDADGRVTSRSVHNYGSATRDAESPHYADQVPLFLEHRDKPVWLDLEDLLHHASRDYRI